MRPFIFNHYRHVEGTVPIKTMRSKTSLGKKVWNKLAYMPTLQRLYSLCKIISLGQNSNCAKGVENDSLTPLPLFYAKDGSKKQLIFEKCGYIENWEKRPPCKGYSLWRIISCLGQNLEIHKKCHKRLFNTIAVVLREKRLEKQLVFEKWGHFENWQKWPPCKGYSLCKIISLGQKLQLKKKLPKTTFQPHCSCSFQKTARKKNEYSKYEAILKIAKSSVWVKI